MASRSETIKEIKSIAPVSDKSISKMSEYELNLVRDHIVKIKSSIVATPPKGIGTRVSIQKYGEQGKEEVYDYQKVKKALNIK